MVLALLSERQVHSGFFEQVVELFDGVLEFEVRVAGRDFEFDHESVDLVDDHA